MIKRLNNALELIMISKGYGAALEDKYITCEATRSEALTAAVIKANEIMNLKLEK